MNSKIKSYIIVILGQTATGKSDLAVEIARKIKPPAKGEIISADSRQVYKGLDLGSGKITEREMRGVPHYLLNVANPKRRFTVTEYQKLANEKIKEILKRGNIPIICGGTGFYIDAITKGIVFPKVPPNTKLRKLLENKSSSELFLILKKLDRSRAKSIDKNNKRRIIRAIEIIKQIGKVPKTSFKKVPYEFIKIGLYLPNDILKKRIEKRLQKRIKSGMINEIKKLHKNGLSYKRLEELGLEYRFVAQYLQGKLTKEEMIERLINEIYHFANRQMQWFKRDTDIIWMDVSK